MSLPIEYQKDLLPYNTFGMQVQAQQMTRIARIEDLHHVLNNNPLHLPYFVLGGGSNLLLTKDIAAWVLKNECKGISLIREDDTHLYVKVQGGEVWHDFVMYCVAHNYAGVENLALIPGTVGAAPIQNIGAYGVEVKEVIDTVHTFDLHSGDLIDFSVVDCKFAYRESVFKRQYKNKLFVHAVTFRLNKIPHYRLGYGDIQKTIAEMQLPITIQSIAQAVIYIRQSKLPDPKEIGNSGSFFKNPEIATEHFQTLKSQYPDIVGYPVSEHTTKVPAGWLIEQCGWKGFREDCIGVHPKQALVLVNYGGAKGADLYQLSMRIIESVKNKYNIDLEREVQVV